MTLLDADGNPIISDQERQREKELAALVNLLLTSFGALKGFMMTTQGPRAAQSQEEYNAHVERVAVKIVNVLGPERVGEYWNMDIRVRKTGGATMGQGPEGVQ